MAEPKAIAYALKENPEHAAIIGDMLLGYANLEFLICDLVAHSLGEGKIGQAVRTLYRLRGANDRLNVADALLRPFMTDLKLIGPYGQWLGAMRGCRLIRNQYAHGAWSDHDGRLRFADLQEAAQPVEGEDVTLLFNPIDLPLLKEQQAFFDYTGDLIMFLAGEIRFRTDRRQTRYRRKLPKSRAAPRLHSPLD